jgi:gas vesicle protein
MRTGKLVLGLLAGIAAGATLGILFAPDKGHKTRRKIARKSSDYAEEIGEKIEEQYHDLVETVSGKFDKMLNEVNKAIRTGQSKAEENGSELVTAARKKLL